MRAVESVKVNGDLIDAILNKNKITAKEFSEKLHYSHSWWSVVRQKKEYIVPKRTAIMITNVLDIKWSDLVGESCPEKLPEIMTGRDFDGFVTILKNIDERLNLIEGKLDGLEWLKK